MLSTLLKVETLHFSESVRGWLLTQSWNRYEVQFSSSKPWLFKKHEDNNWGTLMGCQIGVFVRCIWDARSVSRSVIVQSELFGTWQTTNVREKFPAFGWNVNVGRFLSLRELPRNGDTEYESIQLHQLTGIADCRDPVHYPKFVCFLCDRASKPSPIRFHRPLACLLRMWLAS